MNRWALLAIFLCGVASSMLVYLLTRARHFNIDHPLLLPLVDQLQVFGDDFGTMDFRPPVQSAMAKRKADVDSSEDRTNEALASLRAALEMQELGKHEKALKLYKHAMVLHPRHPDILNHYGEFLEKNRSDVVLADQMYTKAVWYFPEYTRALENRERTKLIVEKLDRSRLRRLDYKRDKLMKISIYDPALMRVKKEAYFQYIYHTVAIEGNTMTLSQTRSIIETGIAIADKSITEQNEVVGIDAALKYINGTLVQRTNALAVQDILEIHKRVAGYVDPVQGGEMRRTQVYVSGYVPPDPQQLNALMEELVQWLNSENVLKMHPVKLAALAHYKLVAIHPFFDGNGRTSRLLVSMILMQAGFPPVIIRKHDRQQYYESLELADEGDVRPFMRFIAECTEKTLDYYLWATIQHRYAEIPAVDKEEMNFDREEEEINFDQEKEMNFDQEGEKKI